MQYKPVQNRVGKWAAGFLSKELGAKITIGELYFEPFSSLHIGDLYVSDQKGDTILFAPQMDARFDLAELFAHQKITVYDVGLSRAFFRLKVDETGQNNLRFLVDYFRPGKPDEHIKRKISLDLRRIRLQDITFSHQNKKTRTSDQGSENGQIDFSNIYADNISGDFRDIDFKNHLAKANISGFSLREKSGFRIGVLNAIAIVDTNRIELRELDLQTNRSHLRDYLLLSFGQFADFADFVNNVSVEAHLEQTTIHSEDIAYFAPDLQRMHFDVDLSGTLSGKVNSIRGKRINLRTGSDTRMQGDLSITGLPAIEETVFDLQLNHFSTSSQDIEKIVPELDPRSTIVLPSFFDQVGIVSFTGGLSGFYHDFEAKGELQTNMGNISTTLGIRLDNPMPHYRGSLHTEGFDIAPLLPPGQTWQAGQIALSASFEGAGLRADDLYAQWDARVGHIDFNQYRYRNISMTGSFTDRELTGKTHIQDPNLNMELEGSWAFRPDTIAHDLSGIMRYADLHALNIYRRDSLVIHSADLRSALHGEDLNSLTGHTNISNLSFLLNKQPFQINLFDLQAREADKGNRSVSIQSDIVQASLTGQMDIYHIWPYLQSMATHYVPALGNAPQFDSRQKFHLEIAVKDFTPISALIAPSFYIASGTTFSGDFATADSTGRNPERQWTSFKLSAPSLSLGTFEAEAIHIHQDANQERMNLKVGAEKIRFANLRTVATLQASHTLRQDTLSYQISLSDTIGQNHTELLGKINYQPDGGIQIQTHPSRLLLNEIPWLIGAATARLRNNGSTLINGLHLTHQNQRIIIDGMISKDPEESLRLTFENFDLGTINPFVQHLKLRLGGTVQGNTRLTSILDKPYAVADLYIDQVALDDLPLGRLGVNADFDRDKSLVNLALDLVKDNKQTLFIGGQYHIGEIGNNLDLLARFDRTDLKVLQVLLKELVSDVSGSLSGQAQITGNLRQMVFNGAGQLDEVAFKVNYLNTPYKARGPISIRNTTFILDELLLTDPRGQQARVNGQIAMQSPTQPRIQADIMTNNFMVLNTTVRENPLYFGTAYATGQFSFNGPPNDMHININARAEEQSVFHIPLNASSSISEHEYIRFIPLSGESPGNSGPVAEAESRILEGLRMDMDLQLSAGATTHIYTDLGELSGRGSGQIALRITSLGDFEMFGDYQVNAGKFTFTAQDFINKIFEIKQGGNIRWTGKPSDATINLTAYYEQRTSLSPLYDAAGRTANEQRILTRAEMYLNGNLMRPGITFGLDFPSDPYVNDELQTYLSDANNVNQQALSLIVRRSFIPGSSTDFGRELNSTLLSAGTELAFNQLNNIISQSLNINFFDLNIRSLNDASVSLRLFDDRLIFTGGITDLRNQRLNDLNVFGDRIATDAELLYLLRKDGRLILRGSNRLNTRHFLLTPTDQYISAFGLIYRKDFNTFRIRRFYPKTPQP